MPTLIDFFYQRRCDYDSVLSMVQCCIIDDKLNAQLLRPFEVEEVKVALFDLCLDKSLVLDEMNLEFYQYF